MWEQGLIEVPCFAGAHWARGHAEVDELLCDEVRGIEYLPVGGTPIYD